MPLGIGNNLIRNGGGLNPDGLSLDLQFAADKTLTARKGPTPVLTRGSGNNGGTTYFGPSSFLLDFTYAGSFYNTTIVQQPSLGLSNGRWRWSDGSDVELKYNGTSWELLYLTSIIYTSSPTTAWLPDSADWGTTGVLIFESGDFGIVKAADNEPRFDHNPVSPFACRGLLIEEGRTNNVTQSGSMNLWGGAGGSTRAVSTVDSPDGNKATIGTSGGSSFGGIIARSLSSFTPTIGTQYTASCFIKKDNWRYVSVDFSALRPAGPAVPFFDLDTLTFNANGASTTTGVIIPYPNGWYRLAVSGAATSATSTGIDIVLTTSTGSANASVGGLVAHIWGAQLEAGSFPTSYIPTTTGTLARAADTCNITGGAFNSFYNQSEGTLFADVSGLMNTTLSGNRAFVSISDGTYQNYIQINKTANSGGLNATGTVSNLTQFNFNNPYSPSTQYKVALGFKTNDANVAYNGTLGTTDTSVTMPSTMNRLELRDPTGATGGQPTGHIAAIRYYKKRLPNAKLQAITA